MTTPEKSDAMEVHSAQAKDEALLSNVTSGGVADVLAKELIREGYTCIGVTYNDVHHRAESIAATDVEETDAFRGSKYIQTYSVDAFRQMVRKAKSVKFAVFGLPCHIYAVHKFLSARNLRNNSVLIDMFCHGCPSMYCWTKYEKEIEQIVNRQSFGEVQFRSKRRGWGNYHVSVDVAGGKSFISTPKHDEFYSLFFSDQVLNDACSDCKLRSTMEYTDIRLGDFWGKAYLGDKKGTSAVVVATERGHRLFETVISQFKIRPHKMSEVTAYQSYGKVYKPNRQLREEMLASLRDEKTPLEEAVEIFYSKQGIKLKAIRLLKTVNYYLPFDLVRFLKSI
jgi:coenzyme F420-reducing hydrogenase beta subunit